MKEYLTTATVNALMEASEKEWVQSGGRREKMRRYWLTEAGKRARRRHHSKRRRNLGFNPLNQPFPESVAHHINRRDVIYMPESIHRVIPHNLKTGDNMSIVNQIAVLYL